MSYLVMQDEQSSRCDFDESLKKYMPQMRNLYDVSIITVPVPDELLIVDESGVKHDY
jgi:hypothetical protein